MHSCFQYCGELSTVPNTSFDAPISRVASAGSRKLRTPRGRAAERASAESERGRFVDASLLLLLLELLRRTNPSRTCESILRENRGKLVPVSGRCGDDADIEVGVVV